MSDRTTLIEDMKRLVEQERLWDEQVYFGDNGITRLRDNGKKTAEPDASSHHPVISLSKEVALKALYDRYHTCSLCPLGATRIKFVFGVGNPEARVLFIGEGPGYEEDRRGEPFVGKAGQLLDKIMASIGLNRQNAYIANIVKCHPMQNPETPEARGNDRAPNAVEVETCSPILRQQISILQPEIIVTLGSPSTRAMLQTTEGITKLRGRLVRFPAFGFSDEEKAILSKTQLLPTYHPAALLRNPDLKKDVWEDMKLLRSLLQ